ncbi:unnamed protein product [Didymodactylos carnosus]|uniref:Homologous recombination OB-fold protein OB-fold domain-containing protein n=1 Tax=Didymodactylos carnosus TaxID=1234261 RepID=A0A814QDD6_9BILA|nr:unnamed protein product [Didymodactylos carnosus]CAF1315013.1 unnamed protein product [Didymodactylos carnosus]CAF3881752.1 unnamed protein product [Didymodactylos carnosus]CAF4123758.1 unnamed protein product [Didymodactylos carnosus]
MNSKTDHPTYDNSLLSSQVPGPVGLLPKLKSADELKRLKFDKINTDHPFLNDSQSTQVSKRQKTDTDVCKRPLSHTRFGSNKKIPLMCVTVTKYDKHGVTILLDRSGDIRASFVGDEDLLEHLSIHIGNTLLLRKVSIYTSSNRNDHYINIIPHNIIAIQDISQTDFIYPISFEETKNDLKYIQNELIDYFDATKNDETFHILSQSQQQKGNEVTVASSFSAINVSKNKRNSLLSEQHVQSSSNTLNKVSKQPKETRNGITPTNMNKNIENNILHQQSVVDDQNSSKEVDLVENIWRYKHSDYTTPLITISFLSAYH